MTKKALVLFGATGSLAKEKVFPALIALNDKRKLPPGLKIISYARKELGKIPLLDFTYIRGDLDNLSSLSHFIKKENINNIFCYIALPPNLYKDVVRLICKNFKGLKLRIALEKPFGVSLSDAKSLSRVLKKCREDNFYLVDHYLAKRSVLNFSLLPRHLRNISRIKNVEINIFEKRDVSERGAFFDSLGALKDTGQNHLLDLASVFLGKGSRTSFFNDLRYKKGSAIFAQYNGYIGTSGVGKNSQTETYFKADFIYKYKLGMTKIGVTLRSGKGLNTTRTFLTIFYRQGSSLCLEINPKENAHEYVIRDFLIGGTRFSVTPNTAIKAWKVIGPTLLDKERLKLRIYPKGASFEEIEN